MLDSQVNRFYTIGHINDQQLRRSIMEGWRSLDSSINRNEFTYYKETASQISQLVTFLFYTIVNFTVLGFGLLVQQNKMFTDIVMSCVSIPHYFMTVYGLYH